MINKIINFARNQPLILNTWNKIYRPFLPIIGLNMQLKDPCYLYDYKEWYPRIKQTQIDKSIPLFADRKNELKEFFKKSETDLIKLFIKNGFPNTRRFKNNMDNIYENNTHEDTALNKAHADAAFFYTVRLMLAYERFSMIIPYLETIAKTTPLEKISVLDYGCGASDIGLLLATLSAKVTIADLDNEKFDFTIWRFKKRNLPVNVIKIKDPSVYPELDKYDLIICTEVFEHVRDPLKLLKNFTKALNPNGYLFDSMGGVFDRDIHGDHLKEAIEIGNSEDYKTYYNKHYKQIKPKENLTFLFKKI